MPISTAPSPGNFLATTTIELCATRLQSTIACGDASAVVATRGLAAATGADGTSAPSASAPSASATTSTDRASLLVPTAVFVLVVARRSAPLKGNIPSA